MKIAISLLLIFMLTAASGLKSQTMDTTNFTAENQTKTASIILSRNIKTVFPLFGAFEERKWSKGWHPVAIYPSSEVIEEGSTFKTPGHLPNEHEYLWRVSKYDTEKYIIQYMVFAEGRCWTITIHCNSLSDNKTTAEITYSFIGLTEWGNQLNRHFIEKIYEHGLKDWEKTINDFLATVK